MLNERYVAKGIAQDVLATPWVEAAVHAQLGFCQYRCWMKKSASVKPRSSLPKFEVGILEIHGNTSTKKSPTDIVVFFVPFYRYENTVSPKLIVHIFQLSIQCICVSLKSKFCRETHMCFNLLQCDSKVQSHLDFMGCNKATTVKGDLSEDCSGNWNARFKMTVCV